MDKFEEKPHWYVVSTYRGGEEKVKENILNRAESLNKTDKILKALVVTSTTVETRTYKSGKVVTKEVQKNQYPGYVYVQMYMDDEVWYIVRNTPNVTGFVGSSGKGTKPTPIPEDEMEKILHRAGETLVPLQFEIGDKINFITGIYNGQVGKVVGVNNETQRADIEVDLGFFTGSLVPDVDFSQIEKVK